MSILPVRASVAALESFVSRLGVAMILLLLAMSCATSPSSTGEPRPTSTRTLTPLPTPTPRQIIERSAVRMAALETAHFTLEVEGDTSAQFFGMELRLLEGEVDMPDSFKLRIEAEATLLRAFIEINMVGIREEIYLQDIFNKEKWIPIPVENLNFNFADLGRTLSDIMSSVQEPTFVGTEVVDDAPSWHLRGTVPSESLKSLATGAAPGFTVTIEGWIGQSQGLIRKLRIVGEVYSGDEPDIARVLTIYGFDEPVEISLPKIPDK